MSVLSDRHFHDEQAAYDFVEARIWPNGPVCPHCGGVERLGKLGGKSTRIGTYKCYQCRKPFTVKIGTIFEASHVPMHYWLQAIFLMASSKKGISANQLHRTLGVTYKTAWFMEMRLREAMRDGTLPVFGGEGKIVEADYHANALRLVADRKKIELPHLAWHEGAAMGSVVGVLKKLDDYDHDREFVIVPPIGDPVTCTFPDSMLGEMGQYWSKIVKVNGILRYRSGSPFPASVEVSAGGVELYRRSPRRTLSQMRGVFAALCSSHT